MAYAGAPLAATFAKWWVLMVVLVLVAHLALLQGTTIFPDKDTVDPGQLENSMDPNKDLFVNRCLDAGEQ